MRAISTAADVTLALLLVGGAVAVVAGGVPVERDDPRSVGSADAADGVARGLAATARVEYRVGVDRLDERRIAHVSLASLLARAAVLDATVDGRRLGAGAPGTDATGATGRDGGGVGFVRAVRATVRGRISRTDVDVAVRARWRPYPDAPIGGSVRVGERPPRDADVHAATLSVPVGAAVGRERALAAADDGYGAVARVAARGSVDVLFRPNGTYFAFTATERLAVARYERAAERLGVGPAEATNATLPNRLVTAGLTARLAADLRGRYPTPRAAARAVSVGRARIVVRTWSP